MGYGDGSVFQRSWDGRWIGRVEAGRDESGRRRRRQVSGRTREEVEAKLENLRQPV